MICLRPHSQSITKRFAVKHSVSDRVSPHFASSFPPPPSSSSYHYYNHLDPTITSKFNIKNERNRLTTTTSTRIPPRSVRPPSGRKMPPKPKDKTGQRAPKEPTPFERYTLPAVLLVLTSAISPISQLTLAPVYGSIPSSVNHQTAIIATFTLGYALWALARPKPGSTKVQEWLAVVACWAPTLQVFIQPYSGKLGPVAGPIINGLLTCHAILIPSAYALSEVADDIDLSGTLGQRLSKIAKPALLLSAFLGMEQKLGAWIKMLLTIRRSLTPLHLQLALACGYSLFYPSFYLLIALPAVLHAIFLNPHLSETSLNSALQAHNWTLVDRQWSNTGYISILDSVDAQYRVMRCDHSLLGGEWLLTDKRKQSEGWKVNEPIYAVFEMLEAVRLMQVTPAIPDEDAQALVIGLGIGTAPKALVAHGIKTTVVELDPVVHAFATQYFSLPTNHTPILQDATTWVRDTAAQNTSKYDYIIHDVFTGGAEPLALFNANFLHNLRSLLTPTGTIAINYAGDLARPLTKRVLHTIAHTFPHQQQCKIYRDGPPEKHGASHSGAAEDFLNMVVFCHNDAGQGPVAFRPPRQADFLGSKSRQYYMLPKPEHEIPFPGAGHGRGGDGGSNDVSHNASPPTPQAKNEAEEAEILRLGDEEAFAKQQAESAIRHWHIMRRVLPDAVWELW